MQQMPRWHGSVRCTCKDSLAVISDITGTAHLTATTGDRHSTSAATAAGPEGRAATLSSGLPDLPCKAHLTATTGERHSTNAATAAGPEGRAPNLLLYHMPDIPCKAHLTATTGDRHSINAATAAGPEGRAANSCIRQAAWASPTLINIAAASCGAVVASSLASHSSLLTPLPKPLLAASASAPAADAVSPEDHGALLLRLLLTVLPPTDLTAAAAPAVLGRVDAAPAVLGADAPVPFSATAFAIALLDRLAAAAVLGRRLVLAAEADRSLVPGLLGLSKDWAVIRGPAVLKRPGTLPDNLALYFSSNAEGSKPLASHQGAC